MIRSRLLFAVVTLFTLFLALFYRDSDVSFVMLYALVLLFLISLVSVLLAPRLIRVRASVERDTIFKGEGLRFGIELRNSAFFLYPRLRCFFYNPNLQRYFGRGFTGVIAPRPRINQNFQVRFPYRGVYNIGIRNMRATDILGLFHINIQVQQPLTVTVYPKTSQHFTAMVQEELQNTVFRYDRFNEDITSVADMRKYTPSDSLRKIHWKLSAKRGELMVKNYQSLEPNHTILFLDTRRSPVPEERRAEFEDRLVSYVSAAIHYFLQSRRTTDFLYGAGNRLRIDPQGKPEKVLRVLAGIPFEDRQSTLKDCYRFLEEEQGPCNFVAFVHSLDRPLHDAFLELMSLGHNVMIYCCSMREFPLPEEGAKLLESLKVYGATVRQTELLEDPDSTIS